MDTRERMQRIADELRAIANWGLFYAAREGRPYDRERYSKVLALSAELLSLTDARDADEILRQYSGELTHLTPKVCADAALFDSAGRLLLARRADDRLWCIPGGAIEVNETAAEAAAREMREETGVEVRPRDLVAVFDNRFIGMDPPSPVHAYHCLFACDYVAGKPGPSLETLEVGYFAEDALPPLTPSHRPKVALAFQHRSGLLTHTYFDGG